MRIRFQVDADLHAAVQMAVTEIDTTGPLGAFRRGAGPPAHLQRRVASSSRDTGAETWMACRFQERLPRPRSNCSSASAAWKACGSCSSIHSARSAGLPGAPKAVAKPADLGWHSGRHRALRGGQRMHPAQFSMNSGALLGIGEAVELGHEGGGQRYFRGVPGESRRHRQTLMVQIVAPGTAGNRPDEMV